MEKQYVAQTISETIDLDVHEEIHNRYTAALTRGMADTRNMLLRQLLDAATISNHPLGHKSYEIKVDFDAK